MSVACTMARATCRLVTTAPELRPVKPGFKDAIAATISDTCAHGEEFAAAIVNSGSVPTLWRAAEMSEHEPVVLAEASRHRRRCW